uniref:Hypothetical chloroplast RF1 n=1 Tax=Nephroselmis astigmatica TaxID=259378 RepID=A0A088CIK0_9CHLO|nr:hypothetical chloroplast RF1 [Nephroselmis astigmatica]AID67738.1 hypothetical chloroplast RF1 [Nephroselmis astigmatica]
MTPIFYSSKGRYNFAKRPLTILLEIKDKKRVFAAIANDTKEAIRVIQSFSHLVNEAPDFGTAVLICIKNPGFFNILFCIWLGIKSFLFKLITFQWVTELVRIPLFRLDLLADLSRETIVFPQFTPQVVEYPITTQGIYDVSDIVPTKGWNKFFVGFLNASYLILPVSSATIIWLRRLVVEGLAAGIVAGLGSILGWCIFIGAVIFGFDGLIGTWEFLAPFTILLSMCVLWSFVVDACASKGVKMYLQDKDLDTMTLEDWLHPDFVRIFQISFLLSWLEQNVYFDKIFRPLNAEQVSILSRFQTVNLVHDWFVHTSYLLGIFCGALFFGFLLGGFVWVMAQEHLSPIGLVRFDRLFLIAAIAIMMTGIPKYSWEYFLFRPTGIRSQQLLQRETLSYEHKDDFAKYYENRLYNRKRWREENNLEVEYRWKNIVRKKQVLKDLYKLKYGFLEEDVHQPRKRVPLYSDEKFYNFSRRIHKPRKSLKFTETKQKGVIRWPGSVIPTYMEKFDRKQKIHRRAIYWHNLYDEFIYSYLFPNIARLYETNPDYLEYLDELKEINDPQERLLMFLTFLEDDIEVINDLLKEDEGLISKAPPRTVIETGEISRPVSPVVRMRQKFYGNSYPRLSPLRDEERQAWKEEVFEKEKDRNKFLEFISDPMQDPKGRKHTAGEVRSEMRLRELYHFFRMGPDGDLKDLEYITNFGKGWYEDERFERYIYKDQKSTLDTPSTLQTKFKDEGDWRAKTIYDKLAFESQYRKLEQIVEQHRVIGNQFSVEDHYYEKPFEYVWMRRFKETIYNGIPFRAMLHLNIDSLLKKQPNFQFVTDDQKNRLAYHQWAMNGYHQSIREYMGLELNYPLEFPYEFENTFDIFAKLGGAKSRYNHVYRQQYRMTKRLARRFFFMTKRPQVNPNQEPVFGYDQLLPYDPQHTYRWHPGLVQKFRKKMVYLIQPDMDFMAYGGLMMFEPKPFYMVWDPKLRKTTFTNARPASLSGVKVRSRDQYRNTMQELAREKKAQNFQFDDPELLTVSEETFQEIPIQGRIGQIVPEIQEMPSRLDRFERLYKATGQFNYEILEEPDPNGPKDKDGNLIKNPALFSAHKPITTIRQLERLQRNVGVKEAKKLESLKERLTSHQSSIGKYPEVYGYSEGLLGEDRVNEEYQVKSVVEWKKKDFKKWDRVVEKNKKKRPKDYVGNVLKTKSDPNEPLLHPFPKEEGDGYTSMIVDPDLIDPIPLELTPVSKGYHPYSNIFVGGRVKERIQDTSAPALSLEEINVRLYTTQLGAEFRAKMRLYRNAHRAIQDQIKANRLLQAKGEKIKIAMIRYTDPEAQYKFGFFTKRALPEIDKIEKAREKEERVRIVRGADGVQKIVGGYVAHLTSEEEIETLIKRGTTVEIPIKRKTRSKEDHALSLENSKQKVNQDYAKKQAQQSNKQKKKKKERIYEGSIKKADELFWSPGLLVQQRNELLDMWETLQGLNVQGRNDFKRMKRQEFLDDARYLAGLSKEEKSARLEAIYAKLSPYPGRPVFEKNVSIWKQIQYGWKRIWNIHDSEIYLDRSPLIPIKDRDDLKPQRLLKAQGPERDLALEEYDKIKKVREIHELEKSLKEKQARKLQKALEEKQALDKK